ncbi:hypothetical protein BGX38DRAFT_1142388 [Terfezia claveryi]|nr:hypothetical protein BGX38DRAFT_1142388 [Terfezia claveryi]
MASKVHLVPDIRTFCLGLRYLGAKGRILLDILDVKEVKGHEESYDKLLDLHYIGDSRKAYRHLWRRLLSMKDVPPANTLKRSKGLDADELARQAMLHRVTSFAKDLGFRSTKMDEILNGDIFHLIAKHIIRWFYGLMCEREIMGGQVRTLAEHLRTIQTEPVSCRADIINMDASSIPRLCGSKLWGLHIEVKMVIPPEVTCTPSAGVTHVFMREATFRQWFGWEAAEEEQAEEQESVMEEDEEYEEEARRRQEEELARREARRHADEEARRRQARQEARRHADEEARRRQEEELARQEARRHADEEARRRQEEELARQEARRHADEEASRRQEEEQKIAREEAGRQARRRQEEEQEIAREEAGRHAEEQARQHGGTQMHPIDMETIIVKVDGQYDLINESDYQRLGVKMELNDNIINGYFGYIAESWMIS